MREQAYSRRPRTDDVARYALASGLVLLVAAWYGGQGSGLLAALLATLAGG